MKALVVSDIHDRLEAVEAARKVLIHNKIGLVLLLGDLTNLGGNINLGAGVRYYF